MKFTLDWIQDYLKTDKSPQEIANTLDVIGLEVEELEDKASGIKPLITAKVLEAKPHPNADKLQVLKVSTGKETYDVVCGAPNARKDLIGILAREGDFIPAFGEKLKGATIRGVASQGMMCSMRELGLGEDHDGIIDLPANTPIGISASEVLRAPVFFDAEVTSNRGDYLGVKGIARDLAAADAGAFQEDTILPVKGTVPCPIKISLEKDTACPAFFAIYLQDVQNKESPDWLKQRLSAIDIKPKSFLIDITNYMLMDWGRPTHAFDADKLSGDLTIRLAKKGEKFTAIADNKEYTLSGDETVVADKKHVALLSGIMGAKESGCDENTKNILLIAEVLDPIQIMQISRKLKIDSDSKYRFERSVDPQSCEPALNKLAGQILEYCGGHPSSIISVGKIPEDTRKIDYDLAQFKKKIGIEIPVGIAISILQKIGCTVSENGTVLTIIAPTFRADIVYPHDITEELIRLYGYDKVQPEALSIEPFVRPVLTPKQTRIFQTKRLMASMGYHETVSWSFVYSKTEDQIGWHNSSLKIANPITPEHDVLRTSLLSSFIPMIKNNHARGEKNLQIFEVGPVFWSDKPMDQEDVLGFVLTGQSHEKSWDHSEKECTVYDVKSTLMRVLDQWGLAEKVKIESLESARGFHPHRWGVLKLGNIEIGSFGEFHPLLLKENNIKTRAVFGQIYLDRIPLKKKKSTAKNATTFTNLQTVRRDFSFLVPKELEAEKVLKVIRKVSPVIQNVFLFDVYAGKGIEDDYKSISLTVVLEPKKTTFTDEELSQIQKEIINIVTTVGGKVRDGS
ncbi:MAG: phenylalanine--tRNA ligase subunit beta [Alphaproteobacteria bacterium]|nr:phenylalanine--tRNA ligase subunit beta [Alphaproteobacteria bacterium]